MAEDSKYEFRPTVRELLRPTLTAVESLRGSAHIRELADEVSVALDLSDDQLEELLPSGGQTWFEHNMSWTRTQLKRLGLLENSSRGVWAITDKGKAISDRELFAQYDELYEKWLQERQQAAGQDSDSRSSGSSAATTSDGTRQPSGVKPAKAASKVNKKPTPAPADSETWRANLLKCLHSMKPASFERLAQRLLREAGLEDVTVTGGTGDGGIDGTGNLRIGLISFPVFFQCKRYGPGRSVVASSVRDFRGAMSGRGEKGILITNATFTRGARQEATRDGAPTVDLVDGQALTELLKDYELGVRRTQGGGYQVDHKFLSSL